MYLSITSLRTMFTACILFIAGIRFFFIWKKTHNNYHKYFTIFLVSFAIQQNILSIGSSGLFMHTEFGKWFWTIGILFLFLGYAYFIRSIVSVKLLKYEMTIFNASLVYTTFMAIYLLLTVDRITTSILPNGVFLYHPPKTALIFLILYSTFTFGLGFLLYLTEGLKLKDSKLKTRAFLISFGCLFTLIGGPLHGIRNTINGVLFLDVMIVVGIMMIVIGLDFNNGNKPKKNNINT